MLQIGVQTKQQAAKDAAAREQLKTAGFWQCFILGIGIAAGGISTSKWQYILLSGMWSGLISALVCSVGYFMLDLCLSELVGIVPFGGGSFGFVRCSMGPFWGFMAASVEMVLYSIYTVRTVQKLAQIVTIITEMDPLREKLWALCAYVAIAVVHVQGGNLFWATMLGCTLFTLFILVSFFAGSFMQFDFHRWAMDNGNNNGFEPVVTVGTTASLYVQYSYFPMWFYMGICALPLAGQRVKDAHITLPRAIMAAMSTMFVIAILAVFCVACQEPGVHKNMKKVKFIFESGLHSVLGIDQKWIAVMLLVPTFASATGFMFASKHQLASMAESGLMPQIFKTRMGPNSTPVFAVLFCTLLQYSIFLAIDKYLITNYQVTFRLCCSAGCIMYMMVMTAFITFRYKFANMKRHFISPVGVPGAVVGIVIFGQILVGLAFFEQGNHASMIVLVMYMVLMMIYYFAYVQYVQFFSKEEQDNFMKAYILNANKKRKASKWVKMLTAFFVATGLDKIAVRSNRNKTNTGSVVASQSVGAQSVAPSSSSQTEQPIVAPLTGISLRNNKVAVEPSLRTNSTSIKSVKSVQRGQGLRASLAWSGKHFDSEQESRKAFELLHSLDIPEDNHDTPSADTAAKEEDGCDPIVAELLAMQFPEQFVEGEDSDKTQPPVGGDVELGNNDSDEVMVRSVELVST